MKSKEQQKRKVLLLGVDTATRDAIEYLKRRGIYTIVTDYNSPDRMPEKRMADEYWMIDIAETDQLEEKCRQEGITNLFAGNHEFCVDQCMELCRRLNLPFYASESGWRATRDKNFYKQKCRENGLKVPRHYLTGGSLEGVNLTEIKYPVIIKPNDGNGRRGVYIASDACDLEHMFSRSLQFSGTKKVIIEEYVEGDDIFIFGYVHRDRLYLIDVIVNRTILINGEKRFGFFDHNTFPIHSFSEKFSQDYQRLVSDLNCENGICCFQGVLKDNTIYNFEFGFRLDGFCTWRRIKEKCSLNYLESMVDLALGEDNEESFDVRFFDEDRLCLGYTIWGRPGKIAAITGKDELHERDDLIILWDRFKEGDTIPDTSDMRAIVLAVEVFGNTYEEIADKIRGINSSLHVCSPEDRNLLEYRIPDYRAWRQ